MATGLWHPACRWHNSNTAVSTNYQQFIYSRGENIQMVKAKYFSRIGLVWGAGWSQFSVGFSISQFGISIDIGFFWVSLEF